MILGRHLVGFRPPRIAMFLVIIAVVAHALQLLASLPSAPIAALIMGITGFTTMIRAWWLFKVADTAICPTEVSSSLITDDIFAVSRNPMYLGMIMMLAALALFTGSIPFYIAVVIYSALLDRVFCPYEEKQLRAEFGQRYAAYRVQVRRWL